MNLRSPAIAWTVFCSLAVWGIFSAQTIATAAEKSAKKKGEGWVEIFSGEKLDGWKDKTGIGKLWVKSHSIPAIPRNSTLKPGKESW